MSVYGVINPKGSLPNMSCEIVPHYFCSFSQTLILFKLFKKGLPQGVYNIAGNLLKENLCIVPFTLVSVQTY